MLIGAGCSTAKPNSVSSNNSQTGQNTQTVPLSPPTNPGQPAPLIVSTSADSALGATNSSPNTIIATPQVERAPNGSVSPAQRSTESYALALGLYKKSGFYFQFAGCHGNPGVLTMKRGVKFMIDNRDNEVHVIKIGTKSYVLGPYGYAIVTTPNTIGKNFITCDKGGAAVINVAK